LIRILRGRNYENPEEGTEGHNSCFKAWVLSVLKRGLGFLLRTKDADKCGIDGFPKFLVCNTSSILSMNTKGGL
jgi:hypothetical protein